MTEAGGPRSTRPGWSPRRRARPGPDGSGRRGPRRSARRDIAPEQRVRLTPPRRGTHDDARPWVTPGRDTNLGSLHAYLQQHAGGVAQRRVRWRWEMGVARGYVVGLAVWVLG